MEKEVLISWHFHPTMYLGKAAFQISGGKFTGRREKLAEGKGHNDLENQDPNRT